jgi:hypothetical protein
MSSRDSFLAAIVLSVLIFWSAGCIPVDDLGGYWDKGVIDPALEGHWKQLGMKFRSEDNYVSFVKSGEHYLQESNTALFIPEGVPKVGIRTRTLLLGKHKFLIYDVAQYYRDLSKASLEAAAKMALESEETIDPNELQKHAPDIEAPCKGALQKYEVKGDTLIFYSLNNRILSEAIEAGSVKGVIPKEEERMLPKISKLDNDSIQFLIRIANDPNSWTQQTRYKRIQDLQKALKKSRSYPATAKTLKNTIVDVKLPDLKYFAEGKVHVLLRHLQASPEWRVFIEGQRMVCHRRKKQDGSWNDPDSDAGFHSEYLNESSKSEDPWFPIDNQDKAAPMNERNWQQIRYLFRFEKKPFGFHPVWAKEPHVMKFNPLAGTIKIKLKSSNQGIESYLAIGQPNLWFEVFEQTWHESRKKTRNALRLLKKFLGEVRKAEKEIEQNGYATKLVPAGTFRRGRPSLEVKQNYANPNYFDYNVRACVNPGAQGYVYVKVFNLVTKKYLSEEQMGWSTREYLGWSKNPNTLFLYSDRIGISTSTLDLPLDARFELWLHSSDGSPERKLIEKTLSVAKAEK